MEQKNAQENSTQKAPLTREEIRNVDGGVSDNGVDLILGPAGKSNVRADVRLYKIGMGFDREKTLQKISEKYSWTAEVQAAAVHYAASIYDDIN